MPLTPDLLSKITNILITTAQRPNPPYYDAAEIRKALNVLKPEQREEVKQYIRDMYWQRLQKIRATMRTEALGLPAHRIAEASNILTSCSYLVGKQVHATPTAQEVLKVLDRKKMTPAQCHDSAAWIRLLGVDINPGQLSDAGANFARFGDWLQESKHARASKPQLELKQSSKECVWIDPTKTTGRLVTRSLFVSTVALLTCVQYNIPMEALMRQWWHMIAIGKKAYNDSKQNPLPQRIVAAWKAVQGQVDYCYNKETTNWLYTLYMYGKCQCSCGTVMLREMLLQIDPTLSSKVWYELSDQHIRLAVRQNDGGIAYIETTTGKDEPALTSKRMPDGTLVYADECDNFNFGDITRYADTMIQSRQEDGKTVLHVWKTPMIELAKIYAKMWQRFPGVILSSAATNAHAFFQLLSLMNDWYNNWKSPSDKKRAELSAAADSLFESTKKIYLLNPYDFPLRYGMSKIHFQLLDFRKELHF